MSKHTNLSITTFHDHSLCLVAWWDSPDAPYMSAHVCERPDGHEGRHTCADQGCRSWRPNRPEGGDDGTS